MSQTNIRQKRQEVEFVLEQQGTNVQTTNDPEGGGQHRSSLGNGEWLRLNGPFNLVSIDSLTFRIASNNTTVPAGNPLVGVEVRLDAPDGPLLTTVTLTSTGANTNWESQTFAVVDPGGANHLYLVFRSIPGGATGGNLFRLNWVAFDGQGISLP